MVIDYGGAGGEWVKLPKVGEEPKIFHIKTAEKIEDPNYKYNFTKKEPVLGDDGQPIISPKTGKPLMEDVNQGFRYVFTCMDETKFTISSWKPFFAFRDADVQDGDSIKVSHPAEGEWIVEKLNGNQQQPDGEPWEE